MKPEDRRKIVIQWGSAMEWTPTKNMRQRLEKFLLESTPPDQLKPSEDFVGVLPQMEDVKYKEWQKKALRHQLAITPVEHNLICQYAKIGGGS